MYIFKKKIVSIMKQIDKKIDTQTIQNHTYYIERQIFVTVVVMSSSQCVNRGRACILVN